MADDIVGIDLGTTNSEIAVYRGGRAEILADEQGRNGCQADHGGSRCRTFIRRGHRLPPAPENFMGGAKRERRLRSRNGSTAMSRCPTIAMRASHGFARSTLAGPFPPGY